MAVIHEDPLQVEKSGRLVNVLPQDPDVVVGHPEDLNLVVQVRRDRREAGPRAVGLALAVRPLAVAIARTVVAEVGHGRGHQTSAAACHRDADLRQGADDKEKEAIK